MTIESPSFGDRKSEELKNISEVEQIFTSPHIISTREQLKRLIEMPLLNACEVLYDKNIATQSSSANKQDIGSGFVYINLDFDTLSEENKKIGEELGVLLDVGTMCGEGSYKHNTLQIKMSISENTTTKEIEDYFNGVAEKFKKQSMSWAPTFMLGKLKEDYVGPDEPMPSDEEMINRICKDGYYYDSDRKLFYMSEEHFRKANEKIEEESP